MQNFIFGILTLVFSLAGYIAAWILYGKGKTGWALFFIGMAGLLLRVYGGSDLYLHEWDERYHALVAKHMMHDPFRPMLYANPVLNYDFTNWTRNHIWLHKQPMSLWLMAGSMKLFGVNELAIRIPSFIFSMLGIWITFLTGKKLVNEKVGLMACFLYSMMGLIIEHVGGRAATDHVDMGFLFFIQLGILWALLYAEKRKYIYLVLCGLTTGMAILTKWLPALIVFPVFMLACAGGGKINIKRYMADLFLLALITAAVFLPWQVYIHLHFPKEAAWESSYNTKHITEAVEEQAGPWYYHLKKIAPLFGTLAYLPLGWIFVKSLRERKNVNNWILLSWFLIPYLFFSVVETKMTSYILFAAPAVFIIIGYCIISWYAYANEKKFGKWKYILPFLLLVLPARYTIERMKFFDIVQREPEWKKEIVALRQQLYTEKKSVLLNVPRPVETMFYTECKAAYADLPDENNVEMLLFNEGNQVYINETPDMPFAYKMIKKVRFIHLNNEKNVPVPITKYKWK